jgi:hypothetical protein
MELGRVVVPVAGISFVLASVIRWRALENTGARLWLIWITAAWLFVTFINRFTFVAPIRNHFFGSAVHDYATAQHARLYFAVGAFLWIAEEILILAFGIAFFFALRSNVRRDI